MRKHYILGLALVALVSLSAVFAVTRSVAAHPARPLNPSCTNPVYGGSVADTGWYQHGPVETDAFLIIYVSPTDSSWVCTIQDEAGYKTPAGSVQITAEVELCVSHNSLWCSGVVLGQGPFTFTATTSASYYATGTDNVSSGGGVCTNGYTWSSYGSWQDNTGDSNIAYGANYCP